MLHLRATGVAVPGTVPLTWHRSVAHRTGSNSGNSNTLPSRAEAPFNARWPAWAGQWIALARMTFLPQRGTRGAVKNGSRFVRRNIRDEKCCFEPLWKRVSVNGVSKPVDSAAALTGPPTVGQLRRLLPSFCKKHGITRAEVFGSVAAGRAEPGSGCRAGV